VVHSGGNYSVLEGFITESISLGSNQCYEFVINDTYGDGLCCEWGNGFYRLLDASNSVIAEGDSFRWEQVAPFAVNLWPLGRPGSKANKRLEVFPNPGSGLYQIELPQTGNWHLYIYSTRGNLVLEQSIGVGKQSIQVNLSFLDSGVYFVELEVEGGSPYFTPLVKL